jgi:hypothetical protein
MFRFGFKSWFEKETAKLQSVIEQQLRYMNDSKAKSNANIRMLHAQLTQLKEQLTNAQE